MSLLFLCGWKGVSKNVAAETPVVRGAAFPELEPIAGASTERTSHASVRPNGENAWRSMVQGAHLGEASIQPGCRGADSAKT